MQCGALGGRRRGVQGPPQTLFASHRIGGSCLANWQVKLSIKETRACPGQGGGGKNLGLVGNMVKYNGERESLSQGADSLWTTGIAARQVWVQAHPVWVWKMML